MTAVARRRVLGSRAAWITAAWLALGAFVAADAGPAAAPGAESLLDEDALVARVLALADERLALMPAVAAAKWPRHLPVADEVREALVITSAGERARASGLEPGRAKDPRPCLQSLRMDLILRPGYIVTVEPGLYFIPAILNDPARRTKYRDSVNWSLAERHLGLGGVRIEDNLVITEGEPLNLTAAIPKQL